MRWVAAFAYNIGVAISQLANTLTGGDPDESISGRIGKSIRRNGLAARVPWPSFMRSHFLRSIEDDEGGSRAGKRTEIV